MTTSECRKKAKEVLKGRYSESFFVVMVFLVAYLIYKLLDIFKVGVVLYNNSADTFALYKTGNISDIFIKYLFCIASFAVITPLITGGLWWFYQTANGCDNKSILKLYTGFKLNIRSGILYGIMWLIGVISLIPSGICFGGASYIFGIASEYKNQALILFAALQVFMLGIFLLGLYLKCISSIILAPFIFIKNPDKNPFKILRVARRRIYGSKLECIKLMMTYIPPMLFIVTIPFVLPKAVMSVSVFACDRIGDNVWDS